MKRDQVSAIGLPDPTVEVWRVETDATEQGPRAGVPQPTADTLLALQASGPQTGGIEVQTARGGIPSRDSFGSTTNVTQAAGAIWRPSGGEWRGWDPPRTISRWEPIDVRAVDGEVMDPDAVVLEDGTRIVVAELEEGASGRYYLTCYRKEAGASSWTRVDVEDNLAPTKRLRPTIAKLPTGRLHLYRYLDRGDYSGLRWWYSDDGGEVWIFGGDGAVDETLRDSAGVGPTRMRCRYSRGQLMLVARLANSGGPVLRQFGSSDLGHHFQFVADASSSDAAFAAPPLSSFDLSPNPLLGGFVVAVSSLVVAGSVHLLIVADAYRALRFAPQTLVRVAREVAVAADESGALLVLANPSGSDYIHAYGSYDGGSTLDEYYPGRGGAANGSVWWHNDANIGSSWALAVGRGRAHLAHAFSSTSFTSLGPQLAMAYLGGWATPTQPFVRSTESEFDSAGWLASVVAVNTPDRHDLIGAIDVTGTATYLSGSLLLSASGSEATEYGIDLTALGGTTSTLYHQNRVAAFRMVAQVTAGGGLTSLRAGARLVLADDDSASKSDIEIRMSPGAIRVWDDNASAQIGSDITVPTTGLIEVLVLVEQVPSRLVRVFWRQRDNGEDREYALGVDGSFTAATTLAPQVMQFGIFDTGDATQMQLNEVSLAPGISVFGARVAVPVTTDTLGSRLYAGRPYTGLGCYLQARQGPTWRGERWTIEPDPDLGLNRALLEPTPRAPWRADDTTEQQIAIRFDAARSPTLAIALRGSNVPELEVEAWDGSSWVSLGTAVLRSPLPFARTGSVLRPTGEGPRYLGHGDLAGAWVSLSSTVGFAVQHQTEGAWSTTRHPRASIVLDEVLGAAPSSGDGEIVWPDAVLILDLDGIDATAIRLTVPWSFSSIAPPDDYWQIGDLALRWLWPLGSDYDWGDSITEESHTQGQRTRDRLWRGVTVAPPSRTVSLAFSVVDESGLDVEPDPVFIGQAGVSSQATARALAAYLRELSGSAGSLLYVPTVSAGAIGGRLSVLLGRRSGVLGRLADAQIRSTTLPGSTHDARVQDAGEITIEEDP